MQQTFSLTVVGILTVPAASLPNGTVGTAYIAPPLPSYGGIASFDLDHLQRQPASGAGVAGKHGGDFWYAHNPGYLSPSPWSCSIPAP
jgi:hypothetical protein